MMEPHLNKRQLVDSLVQDGVLRTPMILHAFRAVDRADFVPPEYRAAAYDDEALPIGFHQTISQPYTVAFMLELLSPKRGENILDMGSGSGWTTALLADIVGKEGAVHGVEIVPDLARCGKNNLAKYRFSQAEIFLAGATLGSPAHAPFDKILVSAAGDSVPQKLLTQLKVYGTMVLPVRDAVWQVKKISESTTKTKQFEGFAFVPLLTEKM